MSLSRGLMKEVGNNTPSSESSLVRKTKGSKQSVMFVTTGRTGYRGKVEWYRDEGICTLACIEGSKHLAMHLLETYLQASDISSRHYCATFEKQNL
jgi:hypothetical protein